MRVSNVVKTRCLILQVVQVTESHLLIRVDRECNLFCQSTVSYYLQEEIGETS